MANTNPQAIAFSNGRIRPGADSLAKAYYAAKALVNDWNAQNVAAVIIPGDTTVISDGSATDGRKPITNDNAYAIILQAQALVTLYEASAGAPLTAILLVAPNPVIK
jgi:hypothetical protein